MCHICINIIIFFCDEKFIIVSIHEQGSLQKKIPLQLGENLSFATSNTLEVAKVSPD